MVSMPALVDRVPATSTSSPSLRLPASSPSRSRMAPDESWMAASPGSARLDGSVTTPRTVRRVLTPAARAAAMLSTDGSADGAGVAEGLVDGDGLGVAGGVTARMSAASRGWTR